MKTSIKLLLALFVLIVAGLFYAKYDLKGQYNVLDKSDPYFGFETIDGLTFNHIKIEGGNISHLYIEPSETNSLLIEKQMLEIVTYEISADTLTISYPESYTIVENSGRNYWGIRDRSSVIIRYNAVESILARDASIGMELKTQTTFKTQLFGNSNLELFTNEMALQELNIESYGHSQHRINSPTEINNLALLNLSLSDQSLAELYRISSDSVAIKLDSTSRISGDATFFKN